MRGRSLSLVKHGATPLMVVVAFALMAAPAGAHEAPHGPKPTDIKPLKGKALVAERRLRAVETAVLGSAHAAEHAKLREYERSPHWRYQMRAAARHAQAIARKRARLMADEPLDQTGRWIEPQFDIPVFAINS